MKEQSSIKVSNKITPTSHKLEVSANLPQDGTNELMLATARLIDSVRKGSEKVGNMLCNSASIIGKPIGKLIEGKTNEIELANQFITARLIYTKEVNATMHMAYATDEFNEKVEKGEEIPGKIKESDNLLLIQDNASTTSNEEMLKLWAKLYTEEACKEGTVSRKAIKLIETLDAKIAKIIENEIFPFCDNSGIYWGAEDKYDILMLAVDYGFLQKISYVKSNENFKTIRFETISNYKLYVYPGFNYSPTSSNYKLTIPALEIKKCLNKPVQIDILQEISNTIMKNSKNWMFNDIENQKVSLIKPVQPDEKFVICDENNNIVFPQNKTYKSVQEFANFAIANLIFKTEDTNG